MKKLIVLFLLCSATLAYSADTKTTALPENTTPAETDILMIVDDPGGTPASQKITKANLFKNITTESITPIKTSGVPGYSYWFEAETTNELFTGFQGPDDLSVNISHVMPSSAGTVGQVFEIETVQTGQTLANGETGTLVTLKNGAKGTDDDAIEFVIDGGGSAITTGTKGYLEIPWDCTINSVTMLADQSGSAVVDLWVDTYANYPPLDADSITASAVPTITAAIKSQDATLTGWATSLTKGSIVGYNVDSAATITFLTISLKVDK